MKELKVGEFYKVTCAEIRMDDGRNYLILVFDHLHADVQFGFPHQHYHIDGRFELHPRMQHKFGLDKGYTSAVITPDHAKGYGFVGICVREVKCIRSDTGLIIPPNPTQKQKKNILQYEVWYSEFLGKTCKGRKCPHYGTTMIEANGYLICPMHGLTAVLKTEVIVPVLPSFP